MTSEVNSTSAQSLCNDSPVNWLCDKLSTRNLLGIDNAVITQYYNLVYKAHMRYLLFKQLIELNIQCDNVRLFKLYNPAKVKYSRSSNLIFL